MNGNGIGYLVADGDYLLNKMPDKVIVTIHGVACSSEESVELIFKDTLFIGSQVLANDKWSVNQQDVNLMKNAASFTQRAQRGRFSW